MPLHGTMHSGNQSVRWCLGLVLALGCGMPLAHGQWLRLGPFDISAETSLEGIYSTNVEGVRDSDTNLPQKDYFLIWGVDLGAEADLTEEWFLGTELGFEVERHLERKDLDTDNVDDLFGEFSFINEVRTGRYMLMLEASYLRERDVEEDDVDTFVSGSLKTRDPRDTLTLGIGLGYEWGPFSAEAIYYHTRERHDDAEFQIGDEDEDDFVFNTEYDFNSRMTGLYRYEANRVDLKRVSGPGDNEWDELQFVGFRYLIWQERPMFSYTLGGEKEDDVDGTSEWELVHLFEADIEYDISSRVSLELGASYQYEEDEEADDVNFRYDGTLRQQLDPSASHSLSVTREPTDTLGSTADTDSTTIRYEFDKENFFLPELSLLAGVNYDRDEPLVGPTEKAWSYDLTLEHSLDISRSLEQVITYLYRAEDLDTERELLEEHRASVEYIYTF